MKCNICGAELAENATCCDICGAAVVADTLGSSFGELPAKNPGKVLGILSLIFGIIAIVLGTICSCSCACLGSILPAIFAIVGVILGIIGMSKSKAAGFSNPLALVGLILSGVAIVIMLLFIIINGVIGGAGALTDSEAFLDMLDY